MSLLDSQERFLYFRSAERITDLPAFKKSLGKKVRLFSSPPKYDAEYPITGRYLYKVKVNLTSRHFLPPAPDYRPGHYYIDDYLSVCYSDDIAKVTEIIITSPESILELEELGIYDRSVTVEDLLKDKAAAHGIDVKVVQEKVETFLEQEARGRLQDLPTEVNQILSTLDEKTTSYANAELYTAEGILAGQFNHFEHETSFDGRFIYWSLTDGYLNSEISLGAFAKLRVRAAGLDDDLEGEVVLVEVEAYDLYDPVVAIRVKYLEGITALNNDGRVPDIIF